MPGRLHANLYLLSVMLAGAIAVSRESIAQEPQKEWIYDEAGMPREINVEPPKLLAERLFGNNTFRAYRSADFYCYEGPGKIKGLPLTNKLLIRFRPNFSDQAAKKFYLAQFGRQVAEIEAITESSLIKDAYLVKLKISRDALEANESILGKINSVPIYELVMLRGRATDVLPVVIYNGLEAVAFDGVIIDAKSPVTEDILRERLESKVNPLGSFKVKSVRSVAADGLQTGRRYVVEFENLTWPPNIFTLANLLSEQPWANYAQPLFYEVENSGVLFFDIVPDGSPTLGEKRLLILRQESRTGSVKIDKDVLPQLGRGEFILYRPAPQSTPIDPAGWPPGTAPSQGTAIGEAIEDIYFRADEPVVREFEENDRKVTLISWSFWVFAPGEYLFRPVAIPLIVNRHGIEEKLTEQVSPGEVMVGSIIARSPQPITDIQPIKTYHSAEPPALPDLTEKISDNDGLTYYKYLAGIGAIGIAVVMAGGWIFLVLVRLIKLGRSRWISFTNKRRVIRELADIAVRLLKSPEIEDYKAAESALRLVMGMFFNLPHNTCARDLEKGPLADRLASEERKLILPCLSELENRCALHYQPNRETTNLADNLMLVAKMAARRCQDYGGQRRKQ